MSGGTSGDRAADTDPLINGVTTAVTASGTNDQSAPNGNAIARMQTPSTRRP